jgi:hypothetical protein
MYFATLLPGTDPAGSHVASACFLYSISIAPPDVTASSAGALHATSIWQTVAPSEPTICSAVPAVTVIPDGAATVHGLGKFVFADAATISSSVEVHE